MLLNKPSDSLNIIIEMAGSSTLKVSYWDALLALYFAKYVFRIFDFL